MGFAIPVGIIVLGFLLGLVLHNTRARDPTINEPPLLPSPIPIFHHIYRYAFDLENLYRDARNSPWILVPFPWISLAGGYMEQKRLPYGPLLDWALPRILGISSTSLHTFRKDINARAILGRLHRSILDPSWGQLEEVDYLLKGNELRINIFSWIYSLVGTSSTHAMMGTGLLKYDPTLLERNRQFEDDFFLFALGLPRFIIHDAWSNRSRIHDAFGARYSGRILTEYSDAAWWVDRSEGLTSDAGQTENDREVATPTFGLWHA
ncbi:hypothetical protein B0H10DRAFT_1950297 [Mycena sp. CBHHK59/15]|nr:hypothetical protein B0H10DRAFT_1950297 [Mycena sp. CBHHK59/15]